MRAGGVPAALSARGRAGYEAVLERSRPARCRCWIKKRHFSGDASLMHRRLMSARHAKKRWCDRSRSYVRRPAQ
jgi:hypothetical protein